MKKATVLSVLVLALIALPMAAYGDDAAAAFQAKCKVCHGVDGKKLAKADLTSDAVQAKADEALVKFLLTDAKHKTKVPDEAAAKAFVTFIKTLKK